MIVPVQDCWSPVSLRVWPVHLWL